MAVKQLEACQQRLLLMPQKLRKPVSYLQLVMLVLVIGRLKARKRKVRVQPGDVACLIRQIGGPTT